MRATANVTITFGLVTIPTKMYLACSSEKISFNLLSKDGNRVRQQYVDTVTGEVVTECDKGYEYSKGQFVRFTPDEIKSLENGRSKILEIKEFVPDDCVNPVQIEKSYYLGPDKGGERAYSLLAEVLREDKTVAIVKNEEHLFLVKAYRNGLVMYQMFYANEVRDFECLDVPSFEFTKEERAAARMLTRKMASKSLNITKYHNEKTQRIQEAVQKKVDGQDIHITPDATLPSISNLIDALQASIGGDPEPEPTPPKAKAKAKAIHKKARRHHG